MFKPCSVRNGCNTAFLYFHRDLIGLYLDHVFSRPAEAHRLHYLFAALDDAAAPLAGLPFEEKPGATQEQFVKEVHDSMGLSASRGT